MPVYTSFKRMSSTHGSFWMLVGVGFVGIGVGFWSLSPFVSMLTSRIKSQNDNYWNPHFRHSKVMVECMSYRGGHHSTSDDSTR
jgi:hypothetical protein